MNKRRRKRKIKLEDKEEKVRKIEKLKIDRETNSR